jgi:hypothetical protein
MCKSSHEVKFLVPYWEICIVDSGMGCRTGLQGYKAGGPVRQPYAGNPMPPGPKNLAIDTLVTVATGRNLNIYDQPHTVLLTLGDAEG